MNTPTAAPAANLAGATSGFSSVKLSTALVQQARAAAQPLRRSVAGQIEYWATLGRVVEHSGLTVQEARTAIEGYEEAARKANLADMLSDVEARFAQADARGSLAARVRDVVLDNRSKDLTAKKAA